MAGSHGVSRETITSACQNCAFVQCFTWNNGINLPKNVFVRCFTRNNGADGLKYMVELCFTWNNNAGQRNSRFVRCFTWNNWLRRECNLFCFTWNNGMRWKTSDFVSRETIRRALTVSGCLKRHAHGKLVKEMPCCPVFSYYIILCAVCQWISCK